MSMVIAQAPSKEMLSMKRKRAWKEYLFIISLIAWPIIHFLVFWLYVNAESFMLVFQTFKPLEGKYVWTGLDGVKKIFEDMVLGGDPVMNGAMWNSVFSVIPGLFIILPLAFITAYAFFKHVPGERLFRIMFYLPSMISTVVLTMCYKYMVDPQFGPIRILFEKMGFTELRWLASGADNKMIWPLIYLFCVWSSLGSNVILMSGAMQRIPKDLLESGKLDGIGFWREARSIVLPLVMPTVTNFIVLAIMGMFGFMLEPMLLVTNGGNSGEAMTIAMFVYLRANSGVESSIKAAVTIGILFSLLFGPLVLVAKLVFDKLTPKVEF